MINSKDFILVFVNVRSWNIRSELTVCGRKQLWLWVKRVRIVFFARSFLCCKSFSCLVETGVSGDCHLSARALIYCKYEQ